MSRHSRDYPVELPEKTFLNGVMSYRQTRTWRFWIAIKRKRLSCHLSDTIFNTSWPYKCVISRHLLQRETQFCRRRRGWNRGEGWSRTQIHSLCVSAHYPLKRNKTKRRRRDPTRRKSCCRLKKRTLQQELFVLVGVSKRLMECSPYGGDGTPVLFLLFFFFCWFDFFFLFSDRAVDELFTLQWGMMACGSVL
ncbi:hypothetical protein CEXT_30421 [Caerostris extrusa]|uniref:Uncharacterized protein n=1 Tax=Caerostris extrusa TaxID=172846 RepID=A0AAV4QRV9_CAEEX|nr:hypothetical protein CEXT_30421 [Caerostris extrusa]